MTKSESIVAGLLPEYVEGLRVTSKEVKRQR
ncbi:hypothetical protein BH18THE2_BH18THE2_21730 [soil metagenome]